MKVVTGAKIREGMKAGIFSNLNNTFWYINLHTSISTKYVCLVHVEYPFLRYEVCSRKLCISLSIPIYA